MCIVYCMTRTNPIQILAILFPALLAGCSIGGHTRIESLSGHVKLEPNLNTVVYAPVDDTGAEIYLTDLPRSRLARGADLAGVSGHLVHINMFLTPLPGRTPIDRTASNASVRWIVIADGEIGVYTGGGFVLPDGAPGGSSFSADVKRATLELGPHTTRFRDPLGASRMYATFRAPRDVAYTRLVAARFDEIIAALEDTQ